MENLYLGIVGIFVVIGIFFLCRELMCWYWKINKHLENQQTIIQLLTKIEKKLDITKDAEKQS